MKPIDAHLVDLHRRLAKLYLPWYIDTMKQIERVQTGVRLEKNLLKVVRSLADTLDMTMGDLLEGVLLHSFEGKQPFSAETLRRIAALKDVHGLALTAADAHRMVERGDDDR